jgi:hypothetical protein
MSGIRNSPSEAAYRSPLFAHRKRRATDLFCAGSPIVPVLSLATVFKLLFTRHNLNWDNAKSELKSASRYHITVAATSSALFCPKNGSGSSVLRKGVMLRGGCHA